MPEELPPLLVTLKLDSAAFAHFDGLRRRYFPAARNKIPAHVTLFHALPGKEEPTIRQTLQNTCATAPFTLTTSGVWLLGQGVAYTLDAPELLTLHAGLQQHWWEHLSKQDRRRSYKPHITVQNKVSAEEAKALHAALAQSFLPVSITGEGLILWRYMEGYWQHVETFLFPRG